MLSKLILCFLCCVNYMSTSDGQSRDVIFLLHTPWFVMHDDIKEMVNTVYNLAELLPIGFNETRVSVFSFTDNVHEMFGLFQYVTRETLLPAIRNLCDVLQPATGNTKTYRALEYVKNKFSAYEKYLVVFIFEESVSPGQTFFLKFELEESGVTIITIGLGPRLTAESVEPKYYLSSSSDHYLYTCHSEHLCSLVLDTVALFGVKKDNLHNDYCNNQTTQSQDIHVTTSSSQSSNDITDWKSSNGNEGTLGKSMYSSNTFSSTTTSGLTGFPSTWISLSQLERSVLEMLSESSTFLDETTNVVFPQPSSFDKFSNSQYSSEETCSLDASTADKSSITEGFLSATSSVYPTLSSKLLSVSEYYETASHLTFPLASITTNSHLLTRMSTEQDSKVANPNSMPFISPSYFSGEISTQVPSARNSTLFEVTVDRHGKGEYTEIRTADESSIHVSSKTGTLIQTSLYIASPSHDLLLSDISTQRSKYMRNREAQETSFSSDNPASALNVSMFQFYSTRILSVSKIQTTGDQNNSVFSSSDTLVRSTIETSSTRAVHAILPSILFPSFSNGDQDQVSSSRSTAALENTFSGNEETSLTVIISAVDSLLQSSFDDLLTRESRLRNSPLTPCTSNSVSFNSTHFSTVEYSDLGLIKMNSTSQYKTADETQEYSIPSYNSELETDTDTFDVYSSDIASVSKIQAMDTSNNVADDTSNNVADNINKTITTFMDYKTSRGRSPTTSMIVPSKVSIAVPHNSDFEEMKRSIINASEIKESTQSTESNRIAANRVNSSSSLPFDATIKVAPSFLEQTPMFYTSDDEKRMDTSFSFQTIKSTVVEETIRSPHNMTNASSFPYRTSTVNTYSNVHRSDDSRTVEERSTVITETPYFYPHTVHQPTHFPIFSASSVLSDSFENSELSIEPSMTIAYDLQRDGTTDPAIMTENDVSASPLPVTANSFISLEESILSSMISNEEHIRNSHKEISTKSLLKTANEHPAILESSHSFQNEMITNNNVLSRGFSNSETQTTSYLHVTEVSLTGTTSDRFEASEGKDSLVQTSMPSRTNTLFSSQETRDMTFTWKSIQEYLTSLDYTGAESDSTFKHTETAEFKNSSSLEKYLLKSSSLDLTTSKWTPSLRTSSPEDIPQLSATKIPGVSTTSSTLLMHTTHTLLMHTTQPLDSRTSTSTTIANQEVAASLTADTKDHTAFIFAAGFSLLCLILIAYLFTLVWTLTSLQPSKVPSSQSHDSQTPRSCNMKEPHFRFARKWTSSTPTFGVDCFPRTEQRRYQQNHSYDFSDK